MRAVWVVRDVLGSKQRILGLVERAKRYGFTDLVVQVRGRGQAYYRSAIEPPAPREEGLGDPLGFLLGLLEGTGIRVHAWINTLLTWSEATLPEGHVFTKHPEWAMVSRDGKSSLDALLDGTLDRSQVEGAYLCPARPEVVEYLCEVYSEVAREYPVHGIHLDYVRYPSPDYCYCPVCRSAGASWDSYAEFRRNTVTYLATALRHACKRARPEVVFSAAVFPNPQIAAEAKGQDWPVWTHDEVLDLVFPMAYHREPEATFNYLKVVKERSGVPVVGGVGAYLQPPEVMAETLRLLEPLGLAGICFFSYNTFEQNPAYLDRILGGLP